MDNRELVIVGGGPAGMAAALSAYKHGVRDIIVLERDQFLGGILNQCIHSGFGIKYFKEVLTGPEFAERFIENIRETPGIEVSLQSFVARLSSDKRLTFFRPGSVHEIQARAVIMATGCRERTREMIHIPGSRPSGIFSAGLAQKLINSEGLLPGREVVIVGSGDIGLIMARRFTLEGAEVKAIIEIQNQSRGLPRNMVQCVEHFDIPVYFRHTVVCVHGKNRVEKITAARVDEIDSVIPSSSFDIPCDTVLVSVGLIPENELIEMAGVTLDKKTHSPAALELDIPGLFVCGNAFKVYDLADSVAEDSEIAGRRAAEYLKVSK